ncbi:hypothetical protein [Moritella viscosa]|uniref:Lipoprotein n=1 Tax=Moritella viscosa TaxID=80854 RepID=A0ABY1HL11_9GAMM|nr:hypothetical protein [Moritella viscosa]SGY98774.1 Putative uncharacterized protein [Moritella viscosa]SGZ13112.1 Putative uncharacterized protein [Moritella viscosa]SHO27803.1 Putative uncharacterized protein [Moritella viscosa]
MMKLKFLAPLLLPLTIAACTNTYQDANAEQFQDMISIKQTWEGKRLTGPTITLEPQAGTSKALFRADAYMYGRESKNEKHQINTRVNLLVKHTDFGFEYEFVSLNGQTSVAIKQERATFRTCDELCVYDQMFSFSLPKDLGNDDLTIRLQEKPGSNHGPLITRPTEYLTGYQQLQNEIKTSN